MTPLGTEETMIVVPVIFMHRQRLYEKLSLTRS